MNKVISLFKLLKSYNFYRYMQSYIGCFNMELGLAVLCQDYLDEKIVTSVFKVI